ncbi:type 1 glutamine amidotransferase domain-containing protein [Rapidithrix thailandica]|uniref:Type 1 glutamine amidotransferase domain-containing protein n=1 Tax=Rapidithrix thailandica TaxID=413964 RepID=A0AAW9RZ06_9BACT
MSRLEGTRILTFVHNEFDDLSLWYPVLRLREEGAFVYLAGEEAGKAYYGKHGVPALTDFAFEEVDPHEYNGVLIPGGWAVDKLRRFGHVIKFVHDMDALNKTIGHFSHGGSVLISAKILNGRTVTSALSIKEDMENAGANWQDDAVVVEGNLVSSQRQPDLPKYMKTYIDCLIRNKQRGENQLTPQ